MTPLARVIFLPGIYVPTGEKTPFMPVRALGAPQTTCTGPCAGFDDADLEPVGVGMRLGLDDGSDDEAFILAARVVDALHLETDAGQRVDDLGERGRGVEVVFEPGEGEFHRDQFDCTVWPQGWSGESCSARLGAQALSRLALSTRANARDADVLVNFWPMDPERRQFDSRFAVPAVAAKSRGYHHSGVRSTRPSARVTIK